MNNIKEDLNYAKAEPQSPAAKQAKSLNLQYVGFGRYVDPKTRQVTHIVQNDKLVPFNRAVRTNTFQQQNTDDYGAFNAQMMPQTQQLHQILTQTYSPDKFDDKELDAIYQFTTTSYADINNKLSSLPSGIPANKIERARPDDTMPDMIASLDSAMKKVRLPQDTIVYTKLSPDTDINAFHPGQSFKFKGFRDTSLYLGAILNQSAMREQSVGNSGHNQIVILQINIKKNSKGLYAADFSGNADDCEFILPRGTKIDIINGPMNLIGSEAMSNNMSLEVLYFDCQAKT
jgi:hypothetical protein